jgi:hypothetical protein
VANVSVGLERIPTAFLSVSLSEADAEDTSAPPERRAQAAADVERMIDISAKRRDAVPLASKPWLARFCRRYTIPFAILDEASR